MPANSVSSGVSCRDARRVHAAALRLDQGVEERRGRDRLGEEDVHADRRPARLFLLAGVRADHHDRQRARRSRPRIRSAASRPSMPGSSQSRITRPNGSAPPSRLCASRSASPSSALATDDRGNRPALSSVSSSSRLVAESSTIRTRRLAATAARDDRAPSSAASDAEARREQERRARRPACSRR